MNSYEQLQLHFARLGNFFEPTVRKMNLPDLMAAVARQPSGMRALENPAVLGRALDLIEELRHEADDNQIAVVMNDKGEAVAVTRTTKDHRILKAIWSKA